MEEKKEEGEGEKENGKREERRNGRKEGRDGIKNWWKDRRWVLQDDQDFNIQNEEQNGCEWVMVECFRPVTSGKFQISIQPVYRSMNIIQGLGFISSVGRNWGFLYIHFIMCHDALDPRLWSRLWLEEVAASKLPSLGPPHFTVLLTLRRQQHSLVLYDSSGPPCILSPHVRNVPCYKRMA